MQLKVNNVVQCYDQSVFRIVGYRKGYAVGHKEGSLSQRLFKSNGHYAGADKSRNVAKVVG